jgi:hypothetical protein
MYLVTGMKVKTAQPNRLKKLQEAAKYTLYNTRIHNTIKSFHMFSRARDLQDVAAHMVEAASSRHYTQ